MMTNRETGLPITLADAKRIAAIGAHKMDDAAYNYRRVEEDCEDPEFADYYVTAPNGAKYVVTPLCDKGCNCPFNAENGICKHVYWLRRKVKQAIADEARWEQEAEGREAAADAVADGLERGKARADF